MPMVERQEEQSAEKTLTNFLEDQQHLLQRQLLERVQLVQGAESQSVERGASSTWIYIDGIKIRGSSALPKSAIEEVQVVTGGIPANIGDATGGVINISLRSSSRTWFGGGEVISSGLPIGEKSYGLDKFGYNLAEGVASGPIFFRKDENGKKTDPLVGLFIAGNVTYQKDPRPTFGGVYRITDEARDALIANPLRLNISSAGEINGAIYNADFLTRMTSQRSITRSNIPINCANIVTKLILSNFTNVITQHCFRRNQQYL